MRTWTRAFLSSSSGEWDWEGREQSRIGGWVTGVKRSHGALWTSRTCQGALTRRQDSSLRGFPECFCWPFCVTLALTVSLFLGGSATFLAQVVSAKLYKRPRRIFLAVSGKSRVGREPFVTQPFVLVLKSQPVLEKKMKSGPLAWWADFLLEILILFIISILSASS